uniref:Uncharacterized protein n=1 Tax=viral metagenome TaxID=1070528 RepID=A0A6C0EW38_9ZZZZ
MCWNEHVSLNTFLFSSFVLLLIIYNNLFTKYKIQELNNTFIYLFIASFVFIQLIEFFIWKNINNKFYNNMFSIMATVLLLLQPIASIMILSNIQLRNILLFVYLLLAIPFSIYKFSTKHIHSIISKRGHLDWKFFEATPIIWITWLFFFVFSFIYEKKWFGIIFAIVALIITFINYKNDNTAWSMWCWIVNSIMIYYAFYLLIYLPFLEKSIIC